MASTYNSNPAVQSGYGTYGGVAGATDIPDVYSQLSDVYPNLSATNTAASNAVLSDLTGTLSNTTANAIQDAAARYGITSGMGSSGLSKNLSLRDLGLTVEGQKEKGLSDYNSLVSNISKTQTVSPETQIDVSKSNATLSASANPQDATTYALSLYNKYLSQLSSAGSGSTGTATAKLTGNAGGSGTTSPFQVSGASPSVTGGGYTPTTGASAGGYTPVTGNDQGGFDATDATNPTAGKGTSYFGATDGSADQTSNYDLDQLLNSIGMGD